MFDDPAVAVGPGEKVGRLFARIAHARSEIKEAGPRARLRRRQPIVVSTRVVDPPQEARAREALLLEPLAHRDAIERREVGIAGAFMEREVEGAPPFAVAPRDPPVDLAAKTRELGQVFGAGPRPQVK